MFLLVAGIAFAIVGLLIVSAVNDMSAGDY